MKESPDTIHGRMKEGAHLAGYGLKRSLENLKWLLEEERYKQLSANYRNVNDFLRDTKKAFHLLNIDPEERKQIAKLVKELQPEASQRAIADMAGVSHPTIQTDLGGKNLPKEPENMEKGGKNLPPQPWTGDDSYDPTPNKPNWSGILRSDSIEWWTPQIYIEAVHEVMGGIDLDPASSDEANEFVGAVSFFDRDHDGLSQPWHGRVFLNPPYGDEGPPFIEKLMNELNRSVKEAIVLVNSRATDAKWFQPLFDGVICFTDHRIDFNSPHEKHASSTHGSVFIYFGPNEKAFAQVFERFGNIVKRFP